MRALPLTDDLPEAIDKVPYIVTNRHILIDWFMGYRCITLSNEHVLYNLYTVTVISR